VPAVRDAFISGRSHFRVPARPGVGPTSAFQNGAAWVALFLVAAIEQGNAEPQHVAFRLGVNLDPQSPNQPHADGWFAELDDGLARARPPVLHQCLRQKSHKPGEPGRALGTVGDRGGGRSQGIGKADRVNRGKLGHSGPHAWTST
jgi:hypothetical protein